MKKNFKQTITRYLATMISAKSAFRSVKVKRYPKPLQRWKRIDSLSFQSVNMSDREGMMNNFLRINKTVNISENLLYCKTYLNKKLSAGFYTKFNSSNSNQSIPTFSVFFSIFGIFPIWFWLESRNNVGKLEIQA